MKICFLGNDEFSLEILKKLHSNFDLKLVITKNDKYDNKKKKYIPNIVKDYCINNNIDLLQCDKLKEIKEDIFNKDIDIMISASFGMWIPSFLIDKYPIYNVHTSLLPKYRGGAPIFWQLYNNEKYAGVTIMKTVKQMDAGDMLLSDKIEILQDDNFTTINEKLSKIGANLLEKFLNNKDTITPIAQNEQEATFAYIPDKSLEIIDFTKDFQQVLAQIRALNDKPGAKFYVENELFKLGKAKKGDIIYIEPKKIRQFKDKLLIGCKNGSIEVLFIQKQGKKMLPINEFLKGNNLDNKTID